jgi:hypothetical protein
VRTKVRHSQKMTADRIRSLWASFNKAFWAIFVIKLISEQSLKSLNYPDDLAIAFIVLGALNLAMAIVMGLYAYRLSGRRKIFLVLGLLGFIWIGGFGVFIGYFVLRNIKRNAEIRLENSSDNPKVPENSPQMRVSVNDLAASTYRKAGSRYTNAIIQTKAPEESFLLSLLFDMGDCTISLFSQFATLRPGGLDI